MSIFLDGKIKNLKPYIPGEQPKGMDKLVKLNTNESPYPPSPMVLEALRGTEAEKLHLYSDPTCGRAISAAAEFYGLKSTQVFLSNGSDEALAFIFHGLCPQGAVFADITYGFYKVFGEMFGVRATIIPLDEQFRVNTNDYEGKKGTVFIANPNAPTGLLLSLEKIEELLKQDKNRLVVVDEAYIDFGGGSALSLLDRYDNLIVVQTFSKSRSLAGGRIGIAFASEELIGDLNSMKYAFNPYNVNTLSIIAAEAALKDKEYFEQCRKAVIKSRSLLTDGMRSLGFRVLDSAANFIFVGEHADFRANEYYSCLRDNNILVRYFDAPRIGNFVRITVGTEEQTRLLCDTTKKILRKKKEGQTK